MYDICKIILTMAKFIEDTFKNDQVDASPEFCKSAAFVNNFESLSLASVVDRYGTFESWPLSHFIKPYDLAKAGFVYTGYSDKVECVKCKIVLKKFEIDDIPMLEHTRWSPKCPLVRNFFKNNGHL